MPAAPRRIRRTLATVTLTGALLAIALPASAHVTVAADEPTRGAGDAILTFRVPNEQDHATTIKLDIKFPTSATAIASVKPAPKQGWTVTTKTVTFNPPIKTDDGTFNTGTGEVTWTANSPADGIPVGGFESFQVLVGPLPDVAQLAFPAVQTYSNGVVAAWVQPTTDPSNPPDSPAPLLDLALAPGATTASASAAAADAAAATPRYATRAQNSTARDLGIAGIVIGALALLAAVAAFTRRPITAD